MFEQLSDRLQQALSSITRQRFTDKNMEQALRDVKKALIDADVYYPAVKAFLQKLRQETKGEKVQKSLSPAQAMIKIVNEALIEMMGEAAPLSYRAQAPVVMLMAGLQGAGKTTTTAKLAKRIAEEDGKSVMVVSTDVYRPAAMMQLQQVVEPLNRVTYFEATQNDPLAIAQDALAAAKKQQVDVLLVDTAGRLHVDNEMMAEVKGLHHALNPTETLFVVDGMIGQDAAQSAKAFHDAMPLTGIICTKMDGDARGGALLSIRHVTDNVPIKFLGMGEKVDALEPFYPDRMASRILGQGDVLSLIEQIERNTDEKDKQRAEKLAKKVQKGQGFNLEDFRQQMIQMQKMGGFGSIMEKLPGASGMMSMVNSPEAKNQMKQMQAIIDSMTLEERCFPDKVMNASRKQRIARGAGYDVLAVTRVLKQFAQMQKMMKRFGKPGQMQKMMQSVQNLMPGGFPKG